MRSPWRYVAVVTVLAVGSFLLAGCGGEEEAASPTATVDLQTLTPERVYNLLAEAIGRPGFVLHSTVQAVASADDREQTPYYTKDFWIDGQRQALREEFHLDPSREIYDMATEGLVIIVGTYIYVPDDPGEALRFDVENFCPGTDDAILSRFLECGEQLDIPSSDVEQAPRVETDAEYKGQAAIALVWDTPEPTASGESPSEVRIYLEQESFLPLARVVEWWYEGDGGPFAAYVSEYEHEFIAADALSSDFLDPRSIGYGAENTGALLDEIAAEVPVYWLGDEFEPEGDLDPLVLTRISTRRELSRWPHWSAFGGLSGALYYETPRGVPGVNLLLWRRSEWEAFMQTDASNFLSDTSCAQRTEEEIDRTRVTIYVMPQLRYPLSPEALGSCAGRVSATPWTDPTVIAFVDWGDVVLDVRPEVVGDYDSVDAVVAVLKGVRLREQ